ncbi:acyl-CoA dehydrogenase [Streptomyces sp. NPDC002851]
MTAPTVERRVDEHSAEGDADRVARIERLLGDLDADDNPLGHRALLAADRAAAVNTEAEAVLDAYGMHHEFVPRELGGRFDSAETLLRVMRPVFRRDVALGMGYGMTTFMAASDVWMCGSATQRRHTAELLLAGAKAAIAQHETAHTNEFVRSQVRAAPRPGGLTVTGAKPVVNNLHRAAALVLFCRTAPDTPDGSAVNTGTRSHSALLLDPRALPPDRFRVTRRPASAAVGLRGYFADSVRFDDCPVPEDALLGPPGSGVTTALRSFQVSRTLMAALVAAAVDAGLRTAVGVDRERQPGGARRADPQDAAATLTGALVDLLLYDSLAVVATRALQLRPAETSLYSAAVKSLLPRVLPDTMYDLSTVLGARFHTREGRVGLFQKHTRDVPIISLGHAGTAACQATLIPQLRGLARNSWFRDDEAPAALFRPGEPLPPFSYDQLALAGGRDSLSATLLATAASIPGRGPVERALRTLAEAMVGELRDLRGRVLALPPLGQGGGGGRGGGPVSPAWFALTDRYVLVLAAAAVLGVWRHGSSEAGSGSRSRSGSGSRSGSRPGSGLGPGDPFLADPAWAAAALHRIARRLGVRGVELPAECGRRVHQEVLARFADHRGYDLYNTPLPGCPGPAYEE